MRLKLALIPVLLLSSFHPALASEEALSGMPMSQESVGGQLATIQREMDFIKKQIADRRRDQARAGKDGAAMEDDITTLELQFQRFRNNFIATAAEVELPIPEDRRKPEKRDLMQETQDLIAPVFDAMKRVSEKPRRIEALRTGIFYLTDRLAQYDKAAAGLDRTLRAKKYPLYAKELEEAKEDLLHDHDALQVRIDAMERKLNSELQDQRTVFQLVVDGIKDFLTSKGKNIVISFLVFFAVLWIFFSFKRLVFRSQFIHSRMQRFNMSFHVVYSLVAGITGIAAVVLTLHFLNDWFLATIILLIALSISWVAKSIVHHFIHEIRLMFNLGPVKQGERVIWQGVPWLVQTLSFKSTLVNEALQGGTVVLPASVLGTLFSRETVTGEPWFPTRVGDYVLLDDGCFGHVETQTPETVIVATGNTRKHYSISAFLSKNPQNFSNGFEVASEIIIRHEGKAPSLETLRGPLQKAVAEKLAKRLSDGDLLGLDVSLCASGAHITRISIGGHAPGRLASHRDTLKRELHSVASEAWRSLS